MWLLRRLNWYAQLIRFEKPVGWFLLLWPTLMALCGAANGSPPVNLLVVYILGVWVMRSAGCIINDIADRDFDRHVERTQDRPLTSGKITLYEAYALLVLFLILALFLVLQTNTLTLLLSFAALFLCILYPFTKRFFACPQLFLGLAFSWGIPMAYASVLNQVPFEAWLLFAGSVFHPLAYDTLYAMADKKDDIKINIRSSAILFGAHDKVMVLVFHLLTLLFWGAYGLQKGLLVFYPMGLALALVFVCWQQKAIASRNPEACLRAFRQSHLIGLLVLVAMEMDLLINKIQ